MTKVVQVDTFLLAGQFDDSRVLLAACGANCAERRLGCIAKNGRHRAEVEPGSLTHKVLDDGAICFGVLVFY